MIESWPRVEPTIVGKVDYRSIVVKRFQRPGSSDTKVFATIGLEDTAAAGVIALTPDKQVIICHQFRPGPERVMDEIPGGGVEPGEDPQAAAIRELEEETGYKPGSVTPLGSVPRDAYMNGVWHYFLALDCVPVGNGQNLDEHEEIEVGLISIEQLVANAKAGKMTDPQAVLMAYDRLKELQE